MEQEIYACAVPVILRTRNSQPVQCVMTTTTCSA
uniref:Uncharacterized protein LOC8266476 isoform X1 n=1 Tax=Rhizophora mucronata TaxID=61149 RepID=A0A2P2MIU4_RHIMU